MKTNIAFDLDGTLVDTMPVIKSEFEFFGYDLLPQKQYQIKTDPYLNDSHIWGIIKNIYNKYHKMIPYPGATKLLKSVCKLTKGEPILIVTARPRYAAEYTFKLLEYWWPDISFMVAFANNYKEKLKWLNGVDFYIEDRRASAAYLAENGKKVFMPEMEYNMPLPELSHKAGNSIFVLPNIAEINNFVDLFIKKGE